MSEVVAIDRTKLDKLHKELDGKCQKCSQRCDKRVVRVVDELMLCPDCVSGKERPVFTVKNHVLKLCSTILGWEGEQTQLALKQMTPDLVLVDCEEEMRAYWNPDRNSPIFRIDLKPDGKIYRIQFRQKVVGKSHKSIRMKVQRSI